MEEIKNIELTHVEYFEQVKEKKQNITDEELKNVYDNCLELLNKYKTTEPMFIIKGYDVVM